MKKFREIDIEEQFFIDSSKPLLNTISLEIGKMFDHEFESWSLGGLIHNLKNAPLTKAISREVFVLFFNELFERFRFSGTFETYWEVFYSIFDGNLTMAFNSPSEGVLYVDINATSEMNYDFIADEIVDNEYEYTNVIYDDHDGVGNIIFVSAFGLQSQEETDRIVYEMAINGIYTVITLNLS